MISKLDLAKQIERLNPWFADSSYRFSAFERDRFLTKEIKDTYLGKEIAVSISGLRRVGKTSIIKQLINHQLDNNFEPKQIFYFSFDESVTNLEDVLDSYFSRLESEAIYKDEFFICLDELQYVKGWQVVIKKFFDLNQKIQFFISGSSSLYLHQDTQESLAGRIIDLTLPTLSFDEFIYLKKGFLGDVEFSHVLEQKEKLALIKRIVATKGSYLNQLEDFLRFGEFPALLKNLADEKFCNSYLEEGVLNKILKKDIKVFEIEKNEELEKLLRISFGNIAQALNSKNVSNDLEVSQITVKKYLRVLNKANLIYLAKNRLRSLRSQEIAQKKVFATSLNLLANVLNIKSPLDPLNQDFKGHLIENYVFNSLKALGDCYFYNSNKKEVDIVLERENQVLPFEVKTRAKIKKTDLKHLWWYLEKNKLNEGFLATGSDEVDVVEQSGKKIYLFPFWVI